MRVRRSKQDKEQPSVQIDGEVLRQIRQHARSNSKTEVCGVLIGNEDDDTLKIEACIAGVNAAQAGTHVTFTQDTWEHIYKTKDSKYPNERIVGWYHSHPGFGVFLSDHDTFIHKNFFSSPLQVAWVYDPHSDEEGCFGWVGDRIERLSEISVTDEKGGEGAGETGKPEPIGMADEDDEETEKRSRNEGGEDEGPLWLKISVSVLSYILVLAIGFMVCWVIFPRKEVYFLDPQSGLVYEPAPDGKHLQIVPNIRLTPGALGDNPGPFSPGGNDTITTPNNDGKKSNPAPDKDASKEKNVPRQ